MELLNTESILILIYLTLAIYFTVYGWEVIHSPDNTLNIPHPRATAALFGLFFPVFLILGMIKVLSMSNKKES